MHPSNGIRTGALARVRRLRTGLLGLVLVLGGVAHAQSGGAGDCNTVRVLPFPINADRPLTAQVSRGCNLDADTLETVEAFVIGGTIRIETTCRSTILPSLSCQIGQTEIGILAPGDYAIDVVDQDTGNLLFSDSLTVGRVTSVPTLQNEGLLVAILALLGVGLLALRSQSGRSRFSNSRS